MGYFSKYTWEDYVLREALKDGNVPTDSVESFETYVKASVGGGCRYTASDAVRYDVLSASDALELFKKAKLHIGSLRARMAAVTKPRHKDSKQAGRLPDREQFYSSEGISNAGIHCEFTVQASRWDRLGVL